MQDAFALTNDAIQVRAKRDTDNFGAGSTDQSYKLIEHYFTTYNDIFSSMIEKESHSKNNRGAKRLATKLPVEVLTLVSLEAGISCFEHKYDEDDEVDELTFRLRSIGMRLEDECYGHAFREHAKTEAERIEKIIKMSAGSMKRRKALLKKFADEHKFVFAEWEDRDRLLVANWIVTGLVAGPLFGLDDEGTLAFTEEAEEQRALIHAGMILRNPRSFPQTGEVVLWDHYSLHLDGMAYPLIRTYQSYAKRWVERKFRDGEFDRAVDALNHAQAVKWRINKPMMDLVQWCYDNEVPVEGIPPKKSPDLPKKPSEDMEEQERLKVAREYRERKIKNKGYVGERAILIRNLTTAKELHKAGSFWTPMNFDYRGRVYALPSFNFQGADYMRALFEFEEGEVLTEEGLYWLKVHVANCGAFDKIDKQSFDDRVAWVDSKIEAIRNTGRNPKAFVSSWTLADSPFMFVASCKALDDAMCGFPVHLPVSFDGTCSGLQHLCAMTRSPEGALVNLTPNHIPQDIYQSVADLVNHKLIRELEPNMKTRAELLLNLDGGRGVTRSLIKRLVMTYAYSSNQRGMRDMLMDDTMREQAFKVLTGEIKENPFGEDYWVTADYLAKVTRASIQEIVSGPTAAMDFLREMSGLFSHEELPTEWHTPLGFPVLMRYPKIKLNRVQLFLTDKSIKFRPGTAVEAPGIDKRKAKNAASPNFVHSMDACHLMMVLLACKEEGINSVALVHDSFGCLPNHAGKFRALIRRTFREMYEQNDVLEQFREEALTRLEVAGTKVPKVPPKGSLDLSLIEKAEYSFA